MKRWFSLAAVILCFAAYYLWPSSTPELTSKTQSSKARPPSSTVDRETSKSKPRPPVEILPGRSGKKAVRVVAPNQDIEYEARQRDDLLRRYRASAGPANEPFDRLRLRAVDKNRFDQTMGASIGQLLGYVLIETPAYDAPLVTNDTLPVVSSKTNGRLGLVTGTIIVTLREARVAPSLSQNYGLELKYEDKPNRQAYFAATSGTPLDQVVAALEKDENVEAARLEIVQGKKKFQ